MRDDSIISADMQDRLDLFFATTGLGFNPYVERAARAGRIAQLDARSDAELAEMGLTRDEIPQRVFADLLAA